MKAWKRIGHSLWWVRLFRKDWGIGINEGGRIFVMVWSHLMFYMAIQTKYTAPAKFLRIWKDKGKKLVFEHA